MTDLLAAIGLDPLGAALILAGVTAALVAIAQELWRWKRPRRNGIPRVHLVGHAMNRTMGGRK